MITIIDYNAGNIRSVQRACSEVGIQAITTSNPADVAKAEKIITGHCPAAGIRSRYPHTRYLPRRPDYP